MSIEDQFARIAGALEGILEELRARPLIAEIEAPLTGHLLRRDGVLSDENGDFEQSPGQINLRPGEITESQSSRLWHVFSANETRQFLARNTMPQLTAVGRPHVLSVSALRAVLESIELTDLRGYGAAGRGLLGQWLEQIDELI